MEPSGQAKYEMCRTLADFFKVNPQISRYHFAKLLGVTPSYVTRLCLQYPPTPSPQIMLRIEKLTDGFMTPAHWMALCTVPEPDLGPAQPPESKRSHSSTSKSQTQAYDVEPEVTFDGADNAELLGQIQRVVAAEVRRVIAVEIRKLATEMKRDAPKSAPEAAKREDHQRYVTIGFFVHEMMGKKRKSWYYAHLKDEGFPQRVYLPGSTRPSLDYAECLAYQQGGSTTPPWKPKRRSNKEN